MLNKQVRHIITSDWAMALLLLGLFFATNGYTYGWDDQHLEIPLLKSLIDPSLYAGDYYVESLKTNFTSYLYPLLSRVLKVKQIPTAYLVLFILSRFFLFFWIYKLWLLISKSKSSAFLCSLTIIVLGRVEEFLYRTFSHQELALAIIFAGIYVFYKNRFFLASIIFGLAANFHALYSFFPFLYMLVYIVRFSPQRGKTLLKSMAGFTLCALPLVLWVLQKYTFGMSVADKSPDSDWLALYRLACPQNFIFYDHSLKSLVKNPALLLNASKAYLVLIAFYLLNLLFNKRFQGDQKTRTLAATGFCLLVFSFIFSHVFPVRFILDLNLVRNAQFILFFLMGYTTLLLLETGQKEGVPAGLALALLFPFMRFPHFIRALAGMAMMFFLGMKKFWAKDKTQRRFIILTLMAVGFLLSVAGILHQFLSHRFSSNSVRTPVSYTHLTLPTN